jgi:biotin carboxyl carrier protein
MEAKEISSEVSGRILSFLVEVGDRIEAGQEIAIIEAMKMEIPVTASVPGTVSRLLVDPDEMVAEGDAIMIVSR